VESITFLPEYRTTRALYRRALGVATVGVALGVAGLAVGRGIGYSLLFLGGVVLIASILVVVLDRHFGSTAPTLKIDGGGLWIFRTDQAASIAWQDVERARIVERPRNGAGWLVVDLRAGVPIPTGAAMFLPRWDAAVGAVQVCDLAWFPQRRKEIEAALIRFGADRWHPTA
jgi:hypothetical protein